jgi:hypothetical protein
MPKYGGCTKFGLDGTSKSVHIILKTAGRKILKGHIYEKRICEMLFVLVHLAERILNYLYIYS